MHTESEYHVKYTAHLDQILENDNTQDTFTVFTLVDADIKRFINDLPFIKEVVLQHDNAKS